MRGPTLAAALSLAFALQAAAQTGLPSIGAGRTVGGARPGGLIQGGPGRVTRPGPPVRPTPPSQIRPGIPDARLGAGGVRPNTGNIVYPGTPGANQGVGNILSPGLPSLPPIPSLQPIPSVVQPARPSIQEIDRPSGRERGRGVRGYAGAYPIYGVYSYPLVPNVIAVTGSTITRSGSGYVVTVGGEPAPQAERAAPKAAPVESSIVELPDADQLEPDYWLIALQGGLIYAVSEYVVEGRALRFTTLQGDEYVIPLGELDIDFTTKLNRDRGVEIDLE